MKSVVMAAVAVFGILLITGCGTSSNAVVQGSAQALDTMTKMRAIFDKSGGNFDSLSPADQATYNQLAGGAGPGRANWKLMAQNKPKAISGQNQDPRASQGGH
jgi:hypothetical protein